MVHFVLCYPSAKQFVRHWKNSATANDWYKDSEANLLEKRLSRAIKEYEDCEKRVKEGKQDSIKEDENIKIGLAAKCEELQTLVKDLENRCAVSHQLFFIRKIVTHSKCNP